MEGRGAGLSKGFFSCGVVGARDYEFLISFVTQGVWLPASTLPTGELNPFPGRRGCHVRNALHSFHTHMYVCM